MRGKMQHVIATEQMTRMFGTKAVVDRIDLAVPSGKVTGFLGPNGAGKTTAIRMLLGLLRPTAGRISILGRELPGARRLVARSVGALVEAPCHYDHLTARENLGISIKLLGLKRVEIDRVLDLVDLQAAADQRVGSYSLGMRQRLGVARALLGTPRLLILDEPTNGLDPDGIIEFRRLIRSLPERDGISVLLSSHLLAEVEQTADHIALIWRGALLVQSPIDELLAGIGPQLSLEVSDDDRALRLLGSKGLHGRRTAAGICVAVQPDDAAAVNAMLVSHGIGVSRLERVRPSLEAMYMALTGGSGGGTVAEAA